MKVSGSFTGTEGLKLCKATFQMSTKRTDSPKHNEGCLALLIQLKINILI